MTREGIPIAHHVFPGNTADINAFRYALKDVKERFLALVIEAVVERMLRNLEVSTGEVFGSGGANEGGAS